VTWSEGIVSVLVAGPKPLVQMLSDPLIRAINRYQLVSTELARADVGLLFGGRRSALARVNLAAKIWEHGLIHRFVVSGGKPDDAGRTEAEAMATVLKSLGVPASSVLLENQATNTSENVAFSMNVLERHGLLAKTKSVICIGRLSASRRYLMTVERHWPSVIKMLAAANYHSVDPRRWHTDPDLSAEMLGEWKRFRPYLKAGYIRELVSETCPLTKPQARGWG